MDIAVLGLQNAGKSTFVNVISVSLSAYSLTPQRGAFSENMIPTVGFNMRKFKKGQVSIKVWDLGGQVQYRQMWERYCHGMTAIVYA